MKNSQITLLAVVVTFVVTFGLSAVLLPRTNPTREVPVTVVVTATPEPIAQNKCLQSGSTPTVFWLDNGCAVYVNPDGNIKLPWDNFYFTDLVPSTGAQPSAHQVIIIRNTTGAAAKVQAINGIFLTGNISLDDFYRDYLFDRTLFRRLCNSSCYQVDFLEIGTGSAQAQHFDR